MDTLFLAVTGLALLLVLVMALIVARVLREERRRSDARVAALVAMSRGAEPDAPSVAPVAEPVPDEGELELRPSDTATVGVMFAQPMRPSPWGPRIAIAAPLALIVIGAAVAFHPAQPDIGASAPSASATPVRAAVRMPIELLSLKHRQEGATLTVTGLVQNPRTAAPISKVFATAFVFAADGTSLASGRAPLDFTTLGPGDESPFVVTVPVKGEIARYRIGFRGDDGRVIAHVDRRAGSAIARAREERP